MYCMVGDVAPRVATVAQPIACTANSLRQGFSRVRGGLLGVLPGYLPHTFEQVQVFRHLNTLALMPLPPPRKPLELSVVYPMQCSKRHLQPEPAPPGRRAGSTIARPGAVPAQLLPPVATNGKKRARVDRHAPPEPSVCEAAPAPEQAAAPPARSCLKRSSSRAAERRRPKPRVRFKDSGTRHKSAARAQGPAGNDEPPASAPSSFAQAVAAASGSVTGAGQSSSCTRYQAAQARLPTPPEKPLATVGPGP